MHRPTAPARRLLATLALAPLAFTLGCPVEEDDYVAPWPQNTVRPVSYDEGLAAGALRDKADAYDAWHLEWHQPDHGGTVTTFFTDETWTERAAVVEWGDSTIWTGTYLASQAWRYHATGDAQARANAIRMVETLSGHLHVTGRTGYIARYRGSQDGPIYQGDAWCASQDRCFAVEDGPYAGDFWWGSTSRDQYIGWMLGMTVAYDLIDDEPTRALIRADVLEVVGTLIENNWVIIAQDGEPSGTAPIVLPTTQLAWSAMGYHVTGDATILGELKRWLANDRRGALELSSFNLFNKYDQYYGNNLGHTNWYQTLRIAAAYVSDDDHQWMLEHFNENEHSFARLSHNAWFNAIYMGQGGWVSEGVSDPYAKQLVQDLSDFRPAPNARYVLPERDPSTYELDPVSVSLTEWAEAHPDLADLLDVGFSWQAVEAFTVDQQCSTDFLWQRNPFRIGACGSPDGRWVNPGVDYLAAYWLAAYEGLLDKDA